MRAAIYARASTKDPELQTMQLRDIRSYCAARGFSVLRGYIDGFTCDFTDGDVFIGGVHQGQRAVSKGLGPEI